MVTVLVSEPVIRSRHYKQDVCQSRAGEQLGAPFAFARGLFPQLIFFCIANQIISNNTISDKFLHKKNIKKKKVGIEQDVSF